MQSTTGSFLHSILSTWHGPLRSSSFLHSAFIYFERKSVTFYVFSSQLKQNNFNSVVTHELFFPLVYICLFVWLEVIKRYFTSTECNKVNNKKRKNWDFYEIIVENKKFNSHHRLKKYFKEQLRTFLKRNEYSSYNINEKYVLPYVSLLIILRECDTFC